MSKLKATPGPWRISLSDNATPHICCNNGSWDDFVDEDTLVCTMPAEIMKAYNSLANAHLIAAAPDLYEALYNLYIRCEAGAKQLEAAEAALAKARGE